MKAMIGKVSYRTVIQVVPVFNGYYTIPGFDDLYLKQRRTLDPEERKKIVLEMQRMIMDHYLKAIAFWRADYIPLRPELNGYYEPVSLYNNLRFQDLWLSRK